LLHIKLTMNILTVHFEFLRTPFQPQPNIFPSFLSQALQKNLIIYQDLPQCWLTHDLAESEVKHS